jgi:hypothetical protein
MIGGGGRGDHSVSLISKIVPRDVNDGRSADVDPGDKAFPVELKDLVEWRFPDALWIAYERKSEECVVVWILDVDNGYNEWIAHLSLDHRWTLSPVRGPWHTVETSPPRRKGSRKWRKKRRKPGRK